MFANVLNDAFLYINPFDSWRRKKTLAAGKAYIEAHKNPEFWSSRRVAVVNESD